MAGQKISSNTTYKDSICAVFGTGNDFTIDHDGTHSKVCHTGTGSVFYDSILHSYIRVAGTENALAAVANSCVQLYYDNSPKFKTVTDGTCTTGSHYATCFCGKAYDSDRLDGISIGSVLRSDIADVKTAGCLRFDDNICATFGTGSDMDILHNASNSHICHKGTGQLYITSNDSIILRNNSETALYAIPNSCIQLYYDNSAKFKTVADGSCTIGTHYATCFYGKAYDADRLDNITSSQFLRSDTEDIKTNGTLRFNDNIKATFGSSQDMCIFHDINNSIICHTGTGSLYISSNNNLYLRNNAEAAIYAIENSCVCLFYDGTGKLMTKSDGSCTVGRHYASTCLQSPVVCASTAFRTTGTGLRYCAGTGCGCGVDWIASSDRRCKKCIEPYECGLDRVNELLPVNYNWKDSNEEDIGFIAQDVMKVEPKLVAGNEEDGYGLKYDKFAALAIKAIQELSCKVERLENKE